jgi:hypothetical protein
MSMQAAGTDDIVVDNHERPVTDVAHEVLARAGWL